MHAHAGVLSALYVRTPHDCPDGHAAAAGEVVPLAGVEAQCHSTLSPCHVPHDAAAAAVEAPTAAAATSAASKNATLPAMPARASRRVRMPKPSVQLAGGAPQ